MISKPIEFQALSIVRTIHWFQPHEVRPPEDVPLFVVWLGKLRMASWNSQVSNWQEWPDGDFDCGCEVTWWANPQAFMPVESL
jgi:hypothetical protein